MGCIYGIKIQSFSIIDRLNMSVANIRAHYFELQRRLYSALILISIVTLRR